MVEWKKLGDIVKRNKGIPITAGQMTELASKTGDVRVFAAGQTVSDINESDLPPNCANRKPSIIVKSRGYIDFEFYEKPFTHKNEMWSYSFDVRQTGKFIYYFLTTQTEFFRKKAKANSVKLPQLCVADTDDYLIPFPSLSEQTRIVGFLDTFTASIENLKLQIAERRKQYEYYRDQLLDLEGKEGVEMKTLGEVVSKECSLSYGIVQPGDDVPNGIPVVRPIDLVSMFVEKEGLKKTTKEISDSYKRTILKGNEILFCVRGTTGVMSLASEMLKDCNVTRGIVPITIDDKITKMFVYYQLKGLRLQKTIAEKTNGTALRQINVKDLRLLSLMLPPLSEQQRIVSILDTFEASIHNLEQQLAQREKQYEYYRNKLLTFE